MKRLLRWLGLQPEVPPQPEPAAPVVPPPWPELGELIELVKKSARAQAKLALRLDEVEARLAGEISAGRRPVPARESRPPALRWDELLDAMDLLDQAISTMDRSLAPGVAEGLEGVQVRLERFLEQGTLRRQSQRGAVPDGKVVRVVGREHRGGEPGTVTRVLRAAVLEGDRVVREGEVLIEGSKE